MKENKKVAGLFNDKKSIQTYDNLLQYRLSNQVNLLKEIYEKSHKQYFPIGEIFFQNRMRFSLMLVDIMDRRV